MIVSGYGRLEMATYLVRQGANLYAVNEV